MTDDERAAVLRKIAADAMSVGRAYVLSNTADRIERLTAENARLTAEVERLTPKKMTLQEACDVLNRQKHIGHETWRLHRIEGKSMAMIGDGSWWLTEFETKAVAQAYERDAGPIVVREPAKNQEREY